MISDRCRRVLLMREAEWRWWGRWWRRSSTAGRGWWCSTAACGVVVRWTWQRRTAYRNSCTSTESVSSKCLHSAIFHYQCFSTVSAVLQPFTDSLHFSREGRDRRRRWPADGHAWPPWIRNKYVTTPTTHARTINSGFMSCTYTARQSSNRVRTFDPWSAFPASSPMQEGFYPRDVVSAVYATATWLGGWLAGCLSVTRRYCIKTAKPKTFSTIW